MNRSARASWWRRSFALLALAGCDRSDAPPPPDSAPVVATVASAPEVVVSAAEPRDAGPPRSWVEQQLRATGAAEVEGWLANAEQLRLQVLITLVEPGDPLRLSEHGFRVDEEYVYPASAIKLVMATGALRALRRLGDEREVNLGPRTRFMRCKSAGGKCEVPEPDEDKDPDDDQDDEKLLVSREIQRMLSYSDNESYDRLWDLCGHRELQEAVIDLGLASVRLHHRLTTPSSRRTARRVVVMPRGGRAFTLPARTSDLEPPPTPAARLEVGRAHRGASGLVDEPMDFSAKNYVSLRDLHRLLIAVVRPDAPGALVLDLTEEEREVLLRPMTGRLLPGAAGANHKPMLPGVRKVLDDKRLRYVNKAGRAYGFHLDNGYLEDVQSGRAAFVTAVVYANPNGVVNDDDYAYEELSGPLLAVLGEAVAGAVLGAADAGAPAPAASSR